MAEQLPLCECTAHTLFHPTTPPGPFLAHTFETVNYFGHLAVARTRKAAVKSDESIAGQHLLTGLLYPAGPHGQEVGIRHQDRRCFPHPRLRRDHEPQAHGRPAGAVTREPDRQGPLGCSHEQVLDIIWADDYVLDAGLVSQREAWRCSRKRTLCNGIEDRGARIRKPVDGSLGRSQRWIDKRGEDPNAWLQGNVSARAKQIGPMAGGDRCDWRRCAQSHAGSRDRGGAPPTRFLRRSVSRCSCRSQGLAAMLEGSGPGDWHGSTTHTPDTSRVE